MRLCDGDGTVLGAGVLLGSKHVLTCAHVIEGAADVFADFTPRVRARVVPEWFVPPLADRRGDVALLELAQPGPGTGATLRRVALGWDRQVHTFGHPRGLDDGVWTRLTLAGPAGPGGEWLQMNARSVVDQRVRAGFSGAGVVDDPTGAVLGIVVGEYTDDTASLSWMIPVETIVRHLPAVARWVVGDSAADPVFSSAVEPDVALGTAKALANWLARRGSADVVMIIVGSDRAALHRAVALSGRESRPDVFDAPEGTVPEVGSIDLAVDASGKTVDQVWRRILDRAGIVLDESVGPGDQVRAGVPPMTVVVDGVDDAAQPEALVDELLRPLAEHGSRLVLAFHHPSAPSLALARSWQLDTVTHRLDRVEREILALADRQEDLGDRDAHRVATLRLRLTALRVAVASSGPDSVWQQLAACEDSVARAARRTEDAFRRRDELARGRRELSGLLEAYQAKSAEGGLAEDTRLAVLYRKAHDSLWRSPGDLPAAQEAVRAYADAVRDALGGVRS